MYNTFLLFVLITHLYAHANTSHAFQIYSIQTSTFFDVSTHV